MDKSPHIINKTIKLETNNIEQLSLIEHDQQLIKLFDNLPVLVWISDSKGGYVNLNKEYLKLIGIDRNRVSFKDIYERVHPSDASKFIKIFKSRLKLRQTTNVEYRIRQSDGNYAWIIETANPRYDKNNTFIGYLGSCSDITKQKEFEQNANDAQRMAHLGSRVWKFSDNTEIWSDELYRILGLTPREIKPTHDDFIKHIIPEDYPSVLRVINEAIKKRKPFKIQYRILRNTGEIRYIECVGEIRFSNNNPISLHSSIHDVTELNKVAEIKNEFVSTVSHELRTPLTSINGALGLILSSKFGKIDDSVNELIQIAHRNCGQLIRIINDILDIHKIESGRMNFHFELTNISNLIKQTIDANQGFAEQFNVKIKTQITDELATKVDPYRISQVISNLISNAIKFSPQGGEIIVFAKKSNNKIHVGFKDQGPGIPNSFKNKIFNKFEQADSSATRKKGGTGLGLSICKAIIEEHHGEIGYNSRIGVGTTFYFKI